MWILQTNFLTPPNPKIAKKQKSKGPNIGQNEEHKVKKCLENEIFNPQEEKLHNSFLNIHIFKNSSIPLNKTQQYPISLPKIYQNRKIL